MNPANPKMVKRVQGFCARHGVAVSSHVYHKGLFLVSYEVEPDKRVWQVARWDADNTKVAFIDGTQSPLRTGAATMLQRTLAEYGISPTSKPVYRLRDVATFPRFGVLEG